MQPVLTQAHVRRGHPRGIIAAQRRPQLPQLSPHVSAVVEWELEVEDCKPTCPPRLVGSGSRRPPDRLGLQRPIPHADAAASSTYSCRRSVLHLDGLRRRFA
eukprot:609986-Heterocapsa_arctica.AAC.1